MQLQARNLEPGLSGADVSLLHFELNLIGYPPPADEVLNNNFGPGTQQAVMNFQAKYGLKQTGIVDKATAKTINVQVAQQVPVDVVLARLGEAISRYQVQIDKLGQGSAGLAQDVARLNMALQAMQMECEQVKAEATASAKQVAVLEQALATAQARIAVLEKLLANPNGGQSDSFVVRGQVLRSDQQPMVDALVQALHEDEAQTVLLGAGKTNNEGRYEIPYTVASLTPLGKKKANLFVQVLGLDLAVLVASAVHPQAGPVETIDLIVQVAEEPKAGFVVQGHVRGGAGNPLAGLTVRARDRDLPSRQRDEPLGAAVTDKAGFYRIEYTAVNFSQVEKESADLQVRVYGPNSPDDDKTAPLAESPTRFNAQPVETIDLVVTANQYRGPSEYERLLAAVTPLIEPVTIAKLTAEDVDFLAGESGEDGKHLALLVQAALGQERSSGGDLIIPTHVAYDFIPAAAFYGWFRLGLPTDWEELRQQRVSTLRNVLLAAIDQNIIPASLRAEVENILALVPNPQISELTTVLDGAALTPEKLRVVLTQVDALEAVSDQVLTKLVEQNSLAAAEAQSIGLSVSIHRLAGADQALVATMLNSEFASLKSGKLQQAHDLAALEPEDWEREIVKAGSSAPDGVSLAAYARSMALDAASEFPHAAFVQRATQVPTGIPDQLKTLQPLLAKNTNALALDFEALDLTGVNESDREGLRKAHADLKCFANLHPGLGLHELLSKQDSVGDAVELVNQRVGWLRTVFDLNPAVDFLNLDYLPDSAELNAVEFGDLPLEARLPVVENLKAHQRIYTVTNNPITAREIMQAGFHSASAIALTRVPDFVEKTGLANVEALDYHAKALDVGNEAAMNWHRLYEAAQYHAMTPIRAIPSLAQFFRPLKGFAGLLDDQPWCGCAHCQSVLSPAAYFVDLMYYIEENILKDSFRGNEDHPLHLQNRRPDLWELELTCKNTDEYVPYLDLVNEILESYLIEILKHDHEDVHDPEDVAPPDNARELYLYLAAQEGSFKQPFTLPIERLEILLEHFGLSRFTIAKAMGADKLIQARARLKISPKEYELMTIARHSVSDQTFFKKLFKLPPAFSLSSPDAELDPIEMQILLSATGLAHEIVAAVLNTKFVNDDGPSRARIEVVLGKLTPDAVQNNSELVNHLTLRRLDLIHRFVRLWRKLPWTVAELDYVLAWLIAPGLEHNINEKVLNFIFDLLDLNAQWSLPVDELMALCGVFPELGLREPTALFDRLFNQPPFHNPAQRWPANLPIRFTHPAWASSPQGVSTPASNTLSRLLAGLQLADKELMELIDSLLTAPAMGHRSATLEPPTDKSIELSKASISLLYRHARLMRLLKCSMTDFIKLVKLTPDMATRPLAEQTIYYLTDVASVVEFAAWQQTSGFSLDELIYVTGGPIPQGSLDPARIASEIIAYVLVKKSLEFADTVFTQIGETELRSRQIVADNLSQNAADHKAFEVLPNGTSYRLKLGIDPASARLINLPVDEMSARNLLGKYYTMHILDATLGGALSLSPEKTKELRELVHPLPPMDIAAISLTMQGSQDNARLLELVTATVRHSVLFRLASEIVARVQAEKSLEFADTVFTQIGLTDLQSRQIVSANLNNFEVLPSGKGYRLKLGFDPRSTLLVTAGPAFVPPLNPPVDPTLLRNLLNKYHTLHVLDVALGSALNLSPEETTELRKLAYPVGVEGVTEGEFQFQGEIISEPAALARQAAPGANAPGPEQPVFPGTEIHAVKEIQRALQGEENRNRLTALLTETLRYRALLKSKVFDLKSLSFVRSNRLRFGLASDPADHKITTQVVRNVAAYVALATATDADFTTASSRADIAVIQSVLTGVDTTSAEKLAKTLRTDETRIAALKPHLLSLPANPFAALAVLARCLVFSEQLGVSGETLSLMIQEDPSPPATVARLSRAAEDLYGAFRAKYPNEKTFQEKMKPFEDKLRARKRAGLVDFIVSQWPVPFSDPNKLYEFFLIDVLLEGCARTSRVVAAISSLQLYVHRVLMNLEKSADLVLVENVVLKGVMARFQDPAKRNEWYWREHYRVWEANRKVFLYPENYIEPELRDDKTPLFKELEDTLLQQEISEANVHDAYAKYLTGFDEVAHLKIAGAYYDLGTDLSADPEQRDDALHLFGVTQDAPPIYYYRVIKNTLATVPRISAWQKLTLQIPVQKVSPILFEGRLYVFWLETTTKPLTTFVGGDSKFGGYRHNVRIKYSTLRLDGAWSPPQSLRFSDGVTTEESRIVNDPRSESDPTLAERIVTARGSVQVLTGKRNEASDLVTNTRQAITDAEAAVNRPLTPEEGIAAGGVWLTVSAAAGLAYGTATAALAPPDVASALAAAAGLAILVLSVPGATVEKLRAAGVAFTDAFQIAQRKVALLDARMRAQQAAGGLLMATEVLNRAQGELDRLLSRENVISVRWDKSGRNHSEPLDNYKPEGWEWDRVYPDVYSSLNSFESIRVTVIPRNNVTVLLPDELDLTSGVLRYQQLASGPIVLGSSRLVEGLSLGRDSSQLTRSTNVISFAGEVFYRASHALNNSALPGTIVARVLPNSDLQAVNGAAASVIIESKGDVVWMRKVGSTPYLTTRLGTTVTPQLTDYFSHKDASGLLDRMFQQGLQESVLSISLIAGQSRFSGSENPFDLTNPYLTYFRETFFHIPFLVANHLNSQQKFAETQRWYHYIFNPTAADGMLWRYREFNEPMVIQSLRDLLTGDPLALAAYRADPFNPHAIARTRLNAYQKSIVMKYIDNLLDWGDSLFNQFTMESVNEATMLYVMAQDILGPRPPEIGSCGEGKVVPKNYRMIKPGLNRVSDFLIELELPRPSSVNSSLLGEASKLVVKTTREPSKQSSDMAAQTPSIESTLTRGGTVKVDPSSFQPQVVGGEVNQTGGQYWTNVGGTPLKDVYIPHSSVGNGGLTSLGTETDTLRIPENGTGNMDALIRSSGIAGGQVGVREGDKIKQRGPIPPPDWRPSKPDGNSSNKTHPDNKSRGMNYPFELVQKNAVFCIPPNKDLLAYWGRVEDRLFKIRNCMDIAGVRRRLELFAPEIDPRLLVRMKAAGLTLDDVLNSIAGNVPPYRFTYLIDKAKQYAGTVQSFGAQLLSAHEKRDGEELANLRAVHEQNLLMLRTRMTQLEINAAEDALEGLRRQKTAAEYRQNYFRSLSDVGSIASERTQQQHQRQASTFRTQASVAQFIAAILSIIPDVGAPTAMKFGGSQLGAAGRAAADGLNALAAFNEMSASMAGMEASNQRRDQDWRHQVETARREISQIEKQITAAEIRRDIAVHALAVHEKTIEQSEEMFEFFRNEKFTNINLYRLLATRLQGLHRQAFNSALSMARMAEQAYRAERTDDNTLLDGNYWDAGNAGLLAGERLLLDLQELERQYIEKNYRQLEVEQSFSLAQFAPNHLETLRLTGECTFEIPEWFFDLTYPGQYRRRLKAARLTIPCVTGPYTNVGATLRLESSKIRLTVPPLPPSPPPPPPLPQPTPVPLRHTVAIAASKAQYDAGVFDFNFRDERYMPFEGAGAISDWKLSLPTTLRTFDYSTISDVILHLSYTAEFDQGLKDTRESEDEAVVEALLQLLQRDEPTPTNAAMTRLFSLRQEFPDVFHRLVTSPLDTAIDFKIEAQHFPFFLMGKALRVHDAKLRFLIPLNSLGSTTIPRTKLGIGQKVELPENQTFRFVIAPAQPTKEGQVMREFELENVTEGSTELGIAARILGTYVITLTAASPLAPDSPGTGRGAIDPAKLHDIILEIGYSLAP